jgi:hypothetical protein
MVIFVTNQPTAAADLQSSLSERWRCVRTLTMALRPYVCASVDACVCVCVGVCVRVRLCVCARAYVCVCGRCGFSSVARAATRCSRGILVINAIPPRARATPPGSSPICMGAVTLPTDVDLWCGLRHTHCRHSMAALARSCAGNSHRRFARPLLLPLGRVAHFQDVELDLACAIEEGRAACSVRQ